MCLLRREDKQTIGIFQADDIMYKHVSIITSHASKIRNVLICPRDSQIQLPLEHALTGLLVMTAVSRKLQKGRAGGVETVQ